MYEKEFYQVIVMTENPDKEPFMTTHECQTLIDVSRLLITYKPKKGYEITTVHIDLQVKLF